MAKETIDVVGSVEESIHNALLEFAQHVVEEHGIIIEEVSFEWCEFAGAPPRALNVQMRTRKRL